ncbi:MAG: hypothetical protein B7Y97_03210 [Sphingomonas sp. 32-66-10]|nr:MAG: hypothetical protein B7Y97_03210 [Sphingomonas sp. 32-66-10]
MRARRGQVWYRDEMNWDSVRLFAFSAALVAAPATSAQELSLSCEGAMRGMFKDRSAGGMATDNQGNVITGGGSSSRYSDIPTVAQFEMAGGNARLNLPQPPTCSICVGEKGWRNVKQLSVSDTRITGKITYGMFSGTTFEIDRRTGVMTSENGFHGQCKAIDLTKRQF